MLLSSSAQMKQIDNYAINHLNIPSTRLMENAADGIIEAAASILNGNLSGKRICIFCGNGNNGGDGFCAAYKLIDLGASVTVYRLGNQNKMTDDAVEMLSRLSLRGCSALEVTDDFCISKYDFELIIDAILGIGLNSPLRDTISSVVKKINASSIPVISADISTGLSADTGTVMGDAIKADITVTFGMAKIGLFCQRGPEYSGTVRIHDIGIPNSVYSSHIFVAHTITDNNISLPFRPRNSHKGDYGKVLIISGSKGYTGAAAMASNAALRSGAGLVSLGVPECIYNILAAKMNEAMVFPLAEENGKLSFNSYNDIFSRMQNSEVLLLGPGLGRGESVSKLVQSLVLQSDIPIVLDADGINAISENIDILRNSSAKIVLTPHDREFQRLGGDLSKPRIEAASRFAVEYGVTLVLKGPGTIVAYPDGTSAINTTGNPGMATGGSGDVLSGIIASFIGQRSITYPIEKAVWLHGKAGDMCAKEFGEYGMLPTDIISALPKVIKMFERNDP